MSQVEGVDYTPSGIEDLRDELIAMRDKSMEQWPQAIPVTLVLTHTIAVLAYMSDLTLLVDKATARNKELQKMYDDAVGE